MSRYRYLAIFLVFFGLALLIGPIPILLAFIVILIDYFISRHRITVTYPDQQPAADTDGSDEAITTANIDPLSTNLGDPSSVIVVNPIRGNEAIGVILVYDKQGLLVYNDIVVRKADVIDVTFNNSAIPYLPNDYQVVLTTRDASHRYIRIPVGPDSEWAMNVVAQIRQSLLFDQP